MIKEEFKLFLDSAPDAIIIVNSEGIIELVNRQTEKIFGFKREELIGEKVEILIPPEFKSMHVQHRDVYSKSPKTRPMGAGLELYGYRKDGSMFPVEISLSPVQTPGKKYVSAAIRDVTERKKIEADLIALNRQLEESNKELESFSYSVSHDLRAPLRHIIGFSNKMLKTQNNNIDEEGKRVLNKIMESAAKMSLLIDELLKFSRIGKTDLVKQKVDMNYAVKTIVDEMSQIMDGNNVKWMVDNLPDVDADVTQLNLVLQNLIYNAIKFSSKREDPEINISYEENDNEFIFFVKDNGIGFNNEYKGKLFGVFHRLHSENQFEGTGIGLAIVKRVILKHGGRVWAEGELDKGAVFYFSLPKTETTVY